MERHNHPQWAFALLMAAALLVFTSGLNAQSGATAPDQGQAGQAQQQSKTYSGTVMKLQNGKYALVTGKTPQGQLAGHFLDDENDAKKYEGKEVKVTGTLDMASNTIHVTKIVAA